MCCSRAPGLNIDPATLDGKAVARYADAPHQDVTTFLLNIIPNTVVDAFAKGEILQVLLFAVLFGLGLSRMGERGKTVVHVLDEAGGGAVRRDRADHARRAAGRVRRDGVHHRPLRHRHAGAARLPDAVLLPDLRRSSSSW